MNRYLVKATFPDLRGGLANHSTEVNAIDWSDAIKCAGVVFQTRLSGQRITRVQLIVVKVSDEKKK